MRKIFSSALSALPKSPLAEQYCQHWQTDGSADGLEHFLTPNHGLNIVELIDIFLVDQALEWQSSLGPSVEQYLQRFPAVSERPQSVLDLVYGEMRAMQALGLPVDVDAYAARFPDLADPLRRQIEVSEWLSDEVEGKRLDDRLPS